MTRMGAIRTFAHIPFDLVLKRSIGRSDESPTSSRLRPVRLTGGVLGGGSGIVLLRIKEPTDDQDDQEADTDGRAHLVQA